jgi:Domain of unknown function (DUF4037)
MTTVSAIFTQGLELSERFYVEAVAPLIQRHFPGVRHDAARVGAGSEVLGYDTPRSVDHEWGPRLQLFLTSDDLAAHATAIRAMLSERLPKTFRGYSTNFAPTGDRDIRFMQATDGPVDHRVEIAEPTAWLRAHLGFDPSTTIDTLDWLATPWQRLLELTAGAVFRDELGELTAARRALAWYPDDVWRYLLAAQWQRIAEEEAFPGRCAEVGDDLGSANVTARLARDLMRLCLLLDRRYPPYSKWLGSAFGQLPNVTEISADLNAAQRASSWPPREQHLVAAYEAIADLQNATGLSTALEPRASGYYDRPYRVIHADRFARALREAITDDAVRTLPIVGSVDQWVDSTNALGNLDELRRIVAVTLKLGDG